MPLLLKKRCVLIVILLTFFQAKAERPNIIYILADDLGWGDLSCYGQKTLKTTNLDRLAKEGMRFTRHYAGSTVCAIKTKNQAAYQVTQV